MIAILLGILGMSTLIVDTMFLCNVNPNSQKLAILLVVSAIILFVVEILDPTIFPWWVVFNPWVIFKFW
jgi:hypothetical protein